MADSKYFSEVIETICCDCPLGVIGCVNVSKEFCGGCPIFPLKNSTTISAKPILRLSTSDTWLPCSRCPHATLKTSKEDSTLLDIHLKDILFCLDCPAKQIRDCINEGCAEARNS